LRFPDHGGTVDDLLRNAGLAIYEAKAAGGNRARVYDPESHAQALTGARLVWKERISGALEEDRFLLYCQPIVDLRTGDLFEYEALLRMVDEDGQILAPTAFLDVAERFGLIGDIDRWVVRRAIGLLADHQRAGRAIRLSVNLSGKAFDDAELLRLIRRELAAAGVDPRLTLEVTETAAIADLDRAQEFISSLKELGCRFALDDFGVGFSSFSQLKHLPVDYLKIDGSFVRDLPRDEVDQRLVKTMVDLARALGRQTIAEFVQDEETVQLLRALGADYGQGNHLGQPVPAAEILERSRPALPEPAQRKAA
jgi:EAL domain-containing protein (putative c-di-GMP-specific phosphodiesterase class I)